jgi:hypothetical protein
MTHLWKSQNDSHRCLEISLRTRDSHIPTSRFLLVKEKKKKTKERRMNPPSVDHFLSGVLVYFLSGASKNCAVNRLVTIAVVP